MKAKRHATACCVLLILLACRAGVAEDEIRIDAPKDWRGERIQLPPTFARDMQLKGVEEIRFAPGMFNPKADDFFSYVIVFRLDGQPELSVETFKRELLAYYTGLAKAVGQGTIKTDGFSVQVTSQKPSAPTSERNYIATLKWIEPFATKQLQSLRIEARVWPGAQDRTWVLMCVSPKRTDDPIWKEMRKVRDRFVKNNPPAPADASHVEECSP